MPSTAVYFVSPRRIAAMAASLMLSGVSWSGSPMARPMMSLPAAFRSRAFCDAAMVGEGWMRWSDSARKPLGRGGMADDTFTNEALTYQPLAAAHKQKGLRAGP